MLYICHILSLLSLALAVPISDRYQLTNIASPLWPFPMESSVVADSRSNGREIIAVRSANFVDLVSATIAVGEPLSMPSTVNQIAPRPASNTLPSSISTIHSQSQWSPSDISNVLFGCITPILGVVAVVVTCYLGRRKLQRGQSDEPVELDDTSTSGTPFNGDIQPLQDLTLSYTSINGALDGANREDTETPVTPAAAD